VGASYGIDKNTWLSARWLSADEISPRDRTKIESINGRLVEVTKPISPLNIDVLMFDLNVKF
jgi:hypothetical protein